MGGLSKPPGNGGVPLVLVPLIGRGAQRQEITAGLTLVGTGETAKVLVTYLLLNQLDCLFLSTGR
jgi:hypothetical protein